MVISSRKVIFVALIGNGLITITKSVAAFMTGSSAMLSEAIHSGADTGNQMLLLYGLRRAKLPADNEFPFGHGKEVYFWSFVVAIVLFAGGAGFSLYKGIDHLLTPVPVKHFYFNYGVIGLSLIFEGTSWYIALKAFARVKAPGAIFRPFIGARIHRSLSFCWKIPQQSSAWSSRCWGSFAAS